MSKYYIIGYTESEVASGSILRLMSIFNKVTTDNVNKAIIAVNQQIKLEKFEVEAWLLSMAHIEEFNKDYSEYFDLVFIEEKLYNLMVKYDYGFKILDVINSEELPKNLALLLRTYCFQV